MMDIKPVGLGAVPKSYGCGIALHSAFPGDRNLTNTYDSFIFRDYNGDGMLTFSRFRRDAGKLSAMKDITEKNGAGGYGEWYSVRLEVNGKTVTGLLQRKRNSRCNKRFLRKQKPGLPRFGRGIGVLG